MRKRLHKGYYNTAPFSLIIEDHPEGFVIYLDNMFTQMKVIATSDECIQIARSLEEFISEWRLSQNDT